MNEITVFSEWKPESKVCPSAMYGHGEMKVVHEMLAVARHHIC